MSAKTRILIVMGTRPEVIKLAPVVIAARGRPDEFDTFVVTTGQHREMLQQMLAVFQVAVDFDLVLLEGRRRVLDHDLVAHDRDLEALGVAEAKGGSSCCRCRWNGLQSRHGR